MKRRDAIRKIGFTTGFVIAAPSIISLLKSCASPTEIWMPIFLTEEQGILLRKIVDVILPKTETPSASEVNVPEFIDKYFYEVMDDMNQEKIKVSFKDLVGLMKKEYDENVINITEDNIKNALDKYMLLKNESAVLEEPLPISELLNTLKWMTINAYRISEIVGETILAYDPIPGTYYCGDLQELTGGKAWSL